MAAYSVAAIAGLMTLATLVLALWTIGIRRGSGILTSTATAAVALLGFFLVVRLASPLAERRDTIRIEDPATLASTLDEALDGAGLLPRVVVMSVTADALKGESPDLGRLIERAVESGVRFDVEMLAAIRHDEDVIEIRWRREDGSFEALSEASLAAADRSSVVRLADAPRSSCRLDGGEWRESVDDIGVPLSDLAGTAAGKAARGWHRLECKDGERRATRYVELRPGVVIATPRGTELELPWRTTLTGEGSAPCEPRVAPARSFDGPSDLALLHANFIGSSGDADVAEDADLLVLDRVEDPALCASARSVLRRGGAVVITPDATRTPRDECANLIPPELSDTPRRDRRPRVRFVRDETFDQLPYPPSCALPECDAHMAQERPDVELGDQGRRIEEACIESLSMIRGEIATCPSGDELVADVRSPPLAPGDVRDDDALRSRMQLADRLSRVFGVERSSEIRWDNRITWVFASKPAPTADGALTQLAEATGDYVVVVPIVDRYALSLHQLDPARETLDGSWASPRVNTEIVACASGDRCIKALDVPSARLTPGGEAQSRSASAARGRFAAAFPDTSAPYPAPVRFLAWKTDPLATTWARSSDRLPPAHYILTDESTTGLESASLAVATMVDRGHLLLLGYSPFEFHDVVDLAGGGVWRDACGVFRQPELSSGLLRSFARATMNIEARAGNGIRDVRETDAGTLRVTVHRSLESAESLTTLRFEASDIVGHLIGFDIPTRSFTYVVEAPTDGCSSLTPMVEGGASTPLVACPAIGDADEELPTEASLRALAAYTGGCVIADNVPCPEPQRPVGRLWSMFFLVSVAAVWGLRLRRALRARAPVEELASSDARTQSRYDPPDELASAAGAWSGRASTWPRTGTFGGYRALEPGDRASALVLDDLIILTRGDASIVPRVALRIEDAAPSTVVLVNLGASMRYPASKPPSKIRLAAHVAELVAGEVWRMRAPASVGAVGVAGNGEMVPSTALHPGRGEVETSVLQAALGATQRPTLPLADQHDECGAVVYISDFQTEALDDVSRWIGEHEAAGIRVAGVLVFSPAEFQFVETGRLAGTGAFVDRADWSPVDVLRAMRRRVENVEAVFDGASGGLTIVSTDMDTRSIELILAERRVFEILR